jgi:hypothetical protein
MSLNPAKITPWLALAIYTIVLVSLLRPGGVGGSLVTEFGASLADVVA